MINKQSVIALDLGTTCGWAIKHNNRTYSGVFKLAPTRFDSYDQRFLTFRKNLQTLLAKRFKGVDLNTVQVFYEEVRQSQAPDAAHMYGGYKAVLTSFCLDHNLSYKGVGVTTIKKFITGTGSAGKDKVIASVRKLGHYPEDDNEADAIAILYYGLAYLPENVVQ